MIKINFNYDIDQKISGKAFLFLFSCAFLCFTLIGCATLWGITRQDGPGSNSEDVTLPEENGPDHSIWRPIFHQEFADPTLSTPIVFSGSDRPLEVPKDFLNSSAVPGPGSCVHIAANTERSAIVQLKEARSAGSAFVTQPHSQQLVFVFQKDPQRLFAVAHPDPSGVFSCDSLPIDPTFAHFDGHTLRSLLPQRQNASPLTTLETPQQASVRISAAQGRSLKGWVLRLALTERAPIRTDVSKVFQDHPQFSNLVRTETNTPGVRTSHHFLTSVILENDSLEMQLAQGKYLAALIHPESHSSCLLPFDASNQLEISLVCRELTSQKSTTGALQTQEALLLPPLREDQSSPLVRFGSLTTATLNSSGQSTVLDLSQQALSSGFSQNDQRRSSLSLILDGTVHEVSAALSSREEESFLSYLADSQVPSHLYIGDSAFQRNPYLIQNRAFLADHRNPTSESLVTYVTNGTTFSWRSPSLDGSVSNMPSDSILSFTVRIPPYNLTEYIELFIDERLHKRIVVGRQDPSSPLEVPFEETIFSKVDFLLTVHAWGKGYVPEFIYGMPFMRPKAILSKICFDVNKNQICDNIREERRP